MPKSACYSINSTAIAMTTLMLYNANDRVKFPKILIILNIKNTVLFLKSLLIIKQIPSTRFPFGF